MPRVVVDSVVVAGLWDPAKLDAGLAASNRRLQQFVEQTANTRVSVQARLDVGNVSNALAALQEKLATVQGPVLPVRFDLQAAAESLASLEHTNLQPVALPVALDPKAFDEALAAFRARAASAPPITVPVTIATTGERISPPVDLTGVGEGGAAVMRDVATAIQGVNAELSKLNALAAGVSDFFGGVAQGAQEALAEVEASGADGAARIDAFRDSVNRSTRDLGKHADGSRKATNAIAALAATSVQAEGPVARLAESALLFSGGEVAVVGFAAAVLGLAVVFNRLTVAEREAREEREKLAQGLHAQVGGGPQDTELAASQLRTGQVRELTTIESLQRGIAAAQERQANLQREITTGLPAQAGSYATALGIALRLFGVQIQILDPITRLLEKLRNERDIRLGLIAIAAEEARTSNEATLSQQAQTASGVSFAASLGQALQAHVRVADAARLTATYERQLRTLIAGGTQDWTVQAQAIAAVNALERGRLAGLLQQSQAQQALATEAAQRLGELESARGDLFAPITIDVDTSEAVNRLNELSGPLAKTSAALHALATPLLLSPVTADLGRELQAQADQIDAFNRRVADDNRRFAAERVEQLAASAGAVIQAVQEQMASQPEILLPIGLDVEGAVASLQEARDAIAARIQASQAAGVAVPAQDAAKLNELEAQLREALALPSRVLIDSTEALSQRLESLRSLAESTRALSVQGVTRPETIAEVSAREAALGPVLDQLRARYEAITAAIADESTPQAQVNALIREQATLLDTLAQHRTATPLEVTQLQPIQEAAQAYADARQKFEAATAQRLRPEARAAAEEMDRAGKVLDTAADSTVRAILALHLSAADTQRILDAIAKAYDNAGRSAHQASAESVRFKTALAEMTQGLAGIVGVAHNIGLIGDETANAISSVLDLTDALGHLKDAAGKVTLGGALGVIGAGLGVAGAVLGPSAAELENQRLLEENNARLRDLAASLDRSIRGIGGQEKVGQAAAALAPLTNVFRGEIGGGLGDQAFAQIAEIAGRFGLTLEQLEAVAKENGITLVHDGQIVSGAFQALADSTGLTIDAMTHFADSFSDQVDFAGLQAKIAGNVGDAVDQFTRDLAGAGKEQSPFIQNFFAGIDIRGDSAAFQKRLQELLKLFAPDSTFFKDHPGLLGGLTPEDWRKILNDGADAMAQLNDQAKALTASFADQLGKSTLRSKLAGESQDPAAQFQREIDALLATVGQASPIIANKLAGLNLGDPDAVRQALTNLFDQFLANPSALTSDQLATLNTFLNDGAGFLDTFNQQVKGASDRLGDLNVPPTFRRAALAFQNANLGPDLGGTTAPTAIPGGQVVNVQAQPVIAPLPEAVQATLDVIAQRTPGDLLAAVDGVRVAATTAPPDLLAILSGVEAATTDGSQRMLDGLTRLADALGATQAAPEDGGTSGTTKPAAPSSPVTITINVTVTGDTSQAPRLGEEIGDHIGRRLERLGVLQTGNNQAFGPT